MNIIKKKKEADEKQRLQEALAEFQETFEDVSLKHVPKTFIRGDVVNVEKPNIVTPALYKPTIIKPVASLPNPEQARKIAEEAAKKIMQEALLKKNSNISVNRPPKPDVKKMNQSTKLSNLEIFKEELKQVQAMRKERKGLRQQLEEKLGLNNEVIDKIAPELDLISTGGEFDDDPTTTNLYVSNLPLHVQMDDLYETFGSFGPLASAKILYPRPDDDRKRDYLCGFIAFMSRTDAARACFAMSGEKLKGSELRVSWARPVVIPPVPFYVPISLRELAMPDPPSGLPFNAKPRTSHLRVFLRKYHNLPRLNAPLPENPELVADYKKMISNSIVRVVIPTERPLLALIHRVIEFIIREGPVFEALLMVREHSNSMYRFLFENHHPTHIYYRWKLYSVLQGEDREKWRLDRFKMFNEGSWWEPPPHSLFDNGMPPQLYNMAYVPKRRTIRGLEEKSRKRLNRAKSPQSEEDNEQKNCNNLLLNKEEKSKKWRGILDDRERDEFEEILRNIVPEKSSIGDAMVWCLDHADCAKQIVQCIYESLSFKEAPLHKKIARVYLCSDILANCGARLRDVFYYRQYFGEYLQKIFVVLNKTLEEIQSRIKAEQFRQRVMLCFRMWEDNSIYPTDVLINMQNIFLGLLKPIEEATIDDLDGEPLIDDDIDGVPLDIDGTPIDDLDKSVPVFEDDFTKKLTKNDSNFQTVDNQFLFKTSTWSQINPVNDGFSSKWDALEETVGDTNSDIEINQNLENTCYRDSSSFISLNFSHRNSSGHNRKQREELMENGDYVEEGELDESFSQSLESHQTIYSKEYEEERRKMLREIEVKVVKLQDELECDRQNKNINEELEKYRKKLTEKMEEKLEKFNTHKSGKLKREKSPKNVKKKENNDSKSNTDLTTNSDYSNRERSGKDRNGDRLRERDRHRSYNDELSTRDRSNRERDRDRDRRDRDRDRSERERKSERFLDRKRR